MQLFILHQRPSRCAHLYVDVHVVKILLEAVQLLYTTWHLFAARDSLDYIGVARRNTMRRAIATPARVYRKTHMHHPIVQWIMQRRAHYVWTVRHALALCAEYSARFAGRTHACEEHVRWLARVSGAPLLDRFFGCDDRETELVNEFCIAIPQANTGSSCRQLRMMPGSDAVRAYRQYYAAVKLPKMIGNNRFRRFGGRKPLPRWCARASAAAQ